ncbi:Rne/Rng family ribonuclease [Mycolicibacterium setense]|uniref:Rne/Rng family ribonuclease n=1 Tax=Mycolicibacterium setense TaxID=431269 RepID=UPI00057452DD|nr:Rne/Rng family ribonuclease [Mycolicibacterium setense]KHO19209.1 ribonuclease [Mycolicibacterium setense]MCV7113123.1 Rne/Rng family ribonuclease [Mycolicibacterium setense]
MAEDAQNDDLSTQTPQQEGLPERLRVHSLARVLGTTSRRVLDALAEFDGRQRSAHSTIDKVDAERVREALAVGSTEAAATEAAVEVATEAATAAAAEQAEAAQAEPVQVEAVAVTVTESVRPDAEPTAEPTAQAQAEADAVLVGDEPESRLILETANIPPAREPHAERADYLPLFVAPQPVSFVQVHVDEDDDDEDEEDGDTGDADSETDDEQADRPAARRRRRGRRGRGRGRGEQADDNGFESGAASGPDSDTPDDQNESDQDSDEDSDESDEGNDEDSTGSDGSTRRRRRRRRRKSGSGDNDDAASPDDPPNTVVHERAPRAERSGKSSDDSEIQGISGSTRLEAKRQRRRDGRDAGRRRPPILSEAEFLARREAVERTMIVRDKVRTEPPHEGARYTQIAVLEDGVVVEHFVTSAASASLVGNIYLGIVQNVLPSMEAAFVDIGRGRNGVLYAGEVNWEAAGLGGSNRKIEQALKPGDYVLVQVSKDPVGHKGARLTTQVSLAGRYLVYVPGASSTGISRKLPDTERQRLKEILKEVVPADAGVIIRTASEGVKEEDIRSDVERLQQRWTEIEAKSAEVTAKKAGAAVALYEEPDVLVKVIRDLFNEDFSGLIVSGDDAWETINSYVHTVAPDLVGRLTKYEPAGGADAPDVFAVHRIEEQLAKAMDRKVWLPSGGTLVIDRTEAMTVVDVNTGKFTGAGGNLEQTVTRNNLEAAEEIVRQLRLRDIGGIVVIDFIDMVLESNRDLVLRRLTEALGRDRTRHQVSEVTSLGLVQLTRKKLGTGLVEAFSTTCTHCAGRGIVLHGDPVDTASSSGGGRKADSNGGSGSGRRSKRGKKGNARPEPEEVQIPKVPAHAAAEHPMFKAMAAANGRDHEDHEGDEDFDEHEHSVGRAHEAEDDEQGAPERAAVSDEAPEGEFDEQDVEESEDDTEPEDESDEDEIDLDDDDLDADDEDDDLDDIDDSDADDDSDDDDSDDDDESDDDSDEDSYEPPVTVVVTPPSRGRVRRRAAARPAGPPVHE